jgi:hypothetical protein
VLKRCQNRFLHGKNSQQEQQQQALTALSSFLNLAAQAFDAPAVFFLTQPPFAAASFFRFLLLGSWSRVMCCMAISFDKKDRHNFCKSQIHHVIDSHNAAAQTRNGHPRP